MGVDGEQLAALRLPPTKPRVELHALLRRDARQRRLIQPAHHLPLHVHPSDSARVSTRSDAPAPSVRRARHESDAMSFISGNSRSFSERP
jgi:hypothetical protein